MAVPFLFGFLQRELSLPSTGGGRTLAVQWAWVYGGQIWRRGVKPELWASLVGPSLFTSTVMLLKVFSERYLWWQEMCFSCFFSTQTSGGAGQCWVSSRASGRPPLLLGLGEQAALEQTPGHHRASLQFPVGCFLFFIITAVLWRDFEVSLMLSSVPLRKQKVWNLERYGIWRGTGICYCLLLDAGSFVHLRCEIMVLKGGSFKGVFPCDVIFAAV